MKPRLGVDLDGVVYEFDSTARWLIKTHHDIDLPPTQVWDGIRKSVKSEIWDWLFVEGLELGLFRHGDLHNGASEALRALSELVHLVVVTQRPKNAINETLAFLAFHKFPVSEVHVLGPDVVKSTVTQCDIYIDDSPVAAEDLERNTDGLVLLWDRPYNQGCSYGKRISSWEELISTVKGVDNEGTRQDNLSHNADSYFDKSSSVS